MAHYFPIAFNNGSHILYVHSTEKSADMTPRYLDPFSYETFSLQDCLRDWTPLFTFEEIQKIKN
jgi:hypothetical protein